MERGTWVGETTGKGSIKDEAEIRGWGDRTEGERSEGRLASGQEIRGQEVPAGEPAFLSVGLLKKDYPPGEEAQEGWQP